MNLKKDNKKNKTKRKLGNELEEREQEKKTKTKLGNELEEKEQEKKKPKLQLLLTPRIVGRCLQKNEKKRT